MFINFFYRSNRLLFRPEAGLNPERISFEYLHGSNFFSNNFIARTAGDISLTANDLF